MNLHRYIRWIADDVPRNQARGIRQLARMRVVRLVADAHRKTPEEIAQAVIDASPRHRRRTHRTVEDAALAFLIRYRRKHNVSPTYQEIADALRIGGPSVASTVVEKLAARGLVKLPRRPRHRGIEIVLPEMKRPPVDSQPAAFATEGT